MVMVMAMVVEMIIVEMGLKVEIMDRDCVVMQSEGGGAASAYIWKRGKKRGGERKREGKEGGERERERERGREKRGGKEGKGEKKKRTSIDALDKT